MGGGEKGEDRPAVPGAGEDLTGDGTDWVSNGASSSALDF